jgi:hypothetical protein
MVKPILIWGAEIDGQAFSCLGSQLALLIESMAAHTADCTWYAGDVNTNSGYPAFANYGRSCARVGTTQILIDNVQLYEQFLDGVFVAVPVNCGGRVDGVDVYTEAPERMQIPGATIEIRTFDTSYFEVYTTSAEIVATLRDRFGGRPGRLESDSHRFR